MANINKRDRILTATGVVVGDRYDWNENEAFQALPWARSNLFGWDGFSWDVNTKSIVQGHALHMHLFHVPEPEEEMEDFSHRDPARHFRHFDFFFIFLGDIIWLLRNNTIIRQLFRKLFGGRSNSK